MMREQFEKEFERMASMTPCGLERLGDGYKSKTIDDAWKERNKVSRFLKPIKDL